MVLDHAGFMHLLRDHPWHIDTLLQMSEVARHQEGNDHFIRTPEPSLNK
jgi:Transcriptional repressor TCF25